MFDSSSQFCSYQEYDRKHFPELKSQASTELALFNCGKKNFQRISRHAEDQVSQFVVNHLNYQLIARNFRCIGSELDIVAICPQNILTAIEVKFRESFNPETYLASSSLWGRSKHEALKRGLLTFAGKVGGLPEHLSLDLAVLTPLCLYMWRGLSDV